MRSDEHMNVKKGLQQEYEEYVAKNQDSYGNGVIIAGAVVGVLLDQGKTCEEAEKGMNGFGLTGFMAGCVAEAIVHFHPRGEEFRKFWNKEWGVKDENTEGVVNPAILVMKEPSKN